MAASVATPAELAARAPRRIERQLASEPIIGKDILELLSSSMYVDPRAIYREYVQNAVDSIEAAEKAGLYADPATGRIDVTLIPESRSIVIRDNGAGIPAGDAERILTAFGASMKRGTAARGFRGVGRLSAFGYAQTVSFKTKAMGEKNATEVKWDCRKLKAALLDTHYPGDLRQLVRDVASVTTEMEKDVASHYFEVRLERVIRIRNDILLNAAEIERYLSEVAPLPFGDDFTFGHDVLSHLSKHSEVRHFRIFLNGSERPLTRPYRDEFSVSQHHDDAIQAIEVHQLSNEDGSPKAVVWLAHHGYQGTLHASPTMRGLRARVGDIQVGDDQIFAKAFPEPRFNSWTVGEVHVLDRRVVPNGRRDGFEQNEPFADLEAQLTPILREIGARCRRTSALRNKLRGFDLRAEKLRGIFGELTTPGITSRRETRLRNEVGTLIADMRRTAVSNSLPPEDRSRLKRRLATLQAEYDGLEILGEEYKPLSGVPAARRGLYEEVLELIRDCSPTKAAAQSLINRLVPRIEAQYLVAKRAKKRSSASAHAARSGSRKGKARRKAG